MSLQLGANSSVENDALLLSLHSGNLFEVDINEVPSLKDPHTYHTVGTKTTRSDLVAKVRGDVAFVQDLRLPHLWHGRLVKPPTANSTLVECPDAIDLPDVEIVRDGSFVGVVARREELAVTAAERLAARVKWQGEPLAPAMLGIPAYLRTHVSKSLPVVNGMPLDEPMAEHVRPVMPCRRSTPPTIGHFRCMHRLVRQPPARSS